MIIFPTYHVLTDRPGGKNGYNDSLNIGKPLRLKVPNGTSGKGDSEWVMVKVNLQSEKIKNMG